MPRARSKSRPRTKRARAPPVTPAPGAAARESEEPETGTLDIAPTQDDVVTWRTSPQKRSKLGKTGDTEAAARELRGLDKLLEGAMASAEKENEGAAAAAAAGPPRVARKSRGALMDLLRKTHKSPDGVGERVLAVRKRLLALGGAEPSTPRGSRGAAGKRRRRSLQLGSASGSGSGSGSGSALQGLLASLASELKSEAATAAPTTTEGTGAAEGDGDGDEPSSTPLSPVPPLTQDELAMLDELEKTLMDERTPASQSQRSQSQSQPASQPPAAPEPEPKPTPKAPKPPKPTPKPSSKASAKDIERRRLHAQSLRREAQQRHLQRQTPKPALAAAAAPAPTATPKPRVTPAAGNNKPTTTQLFSPPADDFLQAACAFLDATEQQPRADNHLPFDRLLVLEKLPGESPYEVRLRTVDEARGNAVRDVVLRDEWTSCPVASGDTIHVIYDDDERAAVVDSNRNLLIVRPDELVPPTTVTGAFPCLRKAMVNDLVPGAPRSGAMVLGNLKHEMFERSLVRRDFSPEALRPLARELLRANVAALFAAGVSDGAATAALEEAVPQMVAWADEFLALRPSPSKEQAKAKAKAKAKPQLQRSSSSPATPQKQTLQQKLQRATTIAATPPRRPPHARISRVVSTEQAYWSPVLGLHGFVDAVVETAAGATLPLELKTGQQRSVSVYHRAQVMLYQLLMTDRGGREEPAAGLLVYLNRGTTDVVETPRGEIRDLIILRNQLAKARERQAGSLTLPPVMRNRGDCERCFAIDSCTLAHRALEGGDGDSFGLPAEFDERTQHLTQAHADYYKTWVALIEMETRAAGRRQDAWLEPSAAREARGTALGRMRLAASAPVEGAEPRFLLTFVRDAAAEAEGAAPLLHSGLHVQDRVIVSPDSVLASPGPVRVRDAAGVVVDLAPDCIVLRSAAPLEGPDVVWRIDRDLVGTGKTTLLRNLGGLFSGPSPELVRSGVSQTQSQSQSQEPPNMTGGDSKRRALVVDLAAPRFGRSVERVAAVLAGEAAAQPADFPGAGVPGCSAAELVRGFAALNPDQRQAVLRVLTADDYALVMGMPGSGKTHTIAFAVRVLVARGLSVLVTAHTHAAVDHQLLKLREAGVPVVRVGPELAVHPRVRDAVLNADGELETVAAYGAAVRGAVVMGVTCLGVSHVAFQARRFDVCVVDEASQLTQPVALGPLRCADTFVLVGDLYQLPPLVRAPEAKARGMDESLFKRLSAAHPRAVVPLRFQYRMNAGIMRVANELVYGHALRCGTAAVAAAALRLPRQPLALHGGGSWLRQALQPAPAVVYLDTDGIGMGLESTGEQRVVNETEARVLALCAAGLVRAGGLPEDAVGVVSPYRSQLKLLDRVVRGRMPGVEVSTIDRYQGRDKDVILVSFVRSNTDGAIGDLLRDWRRINVAFTRARLKLIVVGSMSTLRSSAVLAAFGKMAVANQWVQRLPRGAAAEGEYAGLLGPEGPAPSPGGGARAGGAVRPVASVRPGKRAMGAIVRNVLAGS